VNKDKGMFLNKVANFIKYEYRFFDGYPDK